MPRLDGHNSVNVAKGEQGRHNRVIELRREERHTKSDVIRVALLTGGADRPYAYGLANALASKGVTLDLIANDDLMCPELMSDPGVNFLNFRGNQSSEAGSLAKALRVMSYYVKLIRYARKAEPTIFHILWNNKFELFDRTLLMLYYKLLGKRSVLTLHNINSRRRDSGDTLINRLTLWIQYRLAEHIFAHTEKMKQELMRDFGKSESRITVIPFGINNAVPDTRLTCVEAKERLKLGKDKKAILFFGHIAPYKGLEYLIAAFRLLNHEQNDYQLIIAGRPKNCKGYWAAIQSEMENEILKGRILVRDRFVPDAETETYFKAADVLVLPYRHIYQSGVLFLGYSFGLPVLAADVGSLKEEVVEGRTGFVFRPEDATDLRRTIEHYFESDLYKELGERREEIRDYVRKRNSWDTVGERTMDVYFKLAHSTSAEGGFQGASRMSSAYEQPDRSFDRRSQ